MLLKLLMRSFLNAMGMGNMVKVGGTNQSNTHMNAEIQSLPHLSLNPLYSEDVFLSWG